MKAEELQLFEKYWIEYNLSGPSQNYTGIATYMGPDETGAYSQNAEVFKCVDGIDIMIGEHELDTVKHRINDVQVEFIKWIKEYSKYCEEKDYSFDIEYLKTKLCEYGL